MQYILDKGEFEVLTSRESHAETDIRKKEAAIAFRLIVDEIGCWKEKRTYGYCDDCPLLDLETICTHYRDVSQ